MLRSAVALLAALVREPWARSRVTDLVVELGEARSGDAARRARRRARGSDARGRLLVRAAATSTRRAVRSRLPAAGIGARGDARRAGRSADRGRSCTTPPSSTIPVCPMRSRRRRGWRPRTRGCRPRSGVSSPSCARPAGACSARRDDERRRLERRLRETVERRLTALARTLASARADTAPELRGYEAREEQLAHTLEELGELAAGLHPGGLDEGRLADALASLVARGPVPVELERARRTAARGGRGRGVLRLLGGARERRQVRSAPRGSTISMRAGDGRVQVEVRDDGVGGADIRRAAAACAGWRTASRRSAERFRWTARRAAARG